MKKISKNIYLGAPIIDLREIERLAKESKSIVLIITRGGKETHKVSPAAFVLSMQLRTILRYKIHYALKPLK